MLTLYSLKTYSPHVGILDEVDHGKNRVTVKTDIRKKLSEKELDARELMLRGAHAMKQGSAQPLGAAGVFFYQTPGIGYEYKIIAAIDQVPEALGAASTLDFQKAFMRAYGKKIPGEKRKKK